MKKRLVIIVAAKDFQDLEYQGLIDELPSSEIEFQVASTSKEAYGVYGNVLKVDMLVKEIVAADFDGIAVIGGGGAVNYLGDGDLYKVLTEFNKSNKLVSAICIGPLILADAGVLNGKKATVFYSAVKKLKNRGVLYDDSSDVVVDGNAVTANGPSAAHQYGNAVKEWLLC